MNSVEYVSAYFARVTAAVTQAAEAEKAAIQDDLSTLVGRDFAGNVVVRSAPNEPPRKETGELQANVELSVTATPDGISVTMSSSRPDTPEVPAVLEFEMGRPYMTPSFIRFADRVGDILREEAKK